MVTRIIHEDQAAHVGVTCVDGEHRLVSTATIRAGTLIVHLVGERTNRASRHSVQLDWHVHIDMPRDHSDLDALRLYYWRFLNHSCDPSAIIRGTQVVALRTIDPFEEITFDYDTTEFDMAQPFDCRCRGEHCRGRVRGFRYLGADERERLRPRLAPYLVCLLDDGAEPDLLSTVVAEGSGKG